MAITRIKSSNIEDGTVADVDIADLDSTKLTGTIATARLSNVDLTTLSASNLTTGSIADARVPASAVTQHVTAADLTPAHQGIANLGLIMATEHDKVAFNLTGSFIDIFQDDTGITTETNVDRNASEYVSSFSSSGLDAGGTAGSWGAGNTSENVGGTGSALTYGTGDDLGMNNNSWNYNFISHSSGTDSTTGTAMVVGNCRVSFTGVSVNQGTSDTGTAADYYEWGLMTALSVAGTKSLTAITSDGIYIAFGGNGEDIRIIKKAGTGETLLSTYTTSWTSSQEISLCRNGSTMYLQVDGVTVYTVGSSDFNSSAALKFVCSFGRGQSARAFNDCAFRYSATSLKGISSSTNATGTLISDAQTVASTTEVSGVFTYTDSAGTNTIGTDLKIYFTANNGTNWTEAASYGTATTFSGSVKQVKLGKTTVTAGTQVALKAVWANQTATVAAVAGGFTDYSTQTGGYTPAGGSGNVWALFDNSTATYPVTGGGGTQGFYTDFGSGAGQACNRYTLTSWNGHVNAGPSSWTIYGSNDASTWTTITSQSGASAWGSIENRIFDFSNTTVYRYWGIDLVTITGHAPELCEVEFGVLSAGTAEVTGKIVHLNGWAVNY